MLGKQSGLTYENIKYRYEHFRSRCLNDKKYNSTILENGCVDSLYGKKSKCVMKIVPKSSKIQTFKMSEKCNIERIPNT